MHDSTQLESEGIPTVPVATTEFQQAARVQSAALGRTDLVTVFVAHPIQDQTDAELHARADAVIRELVDRLTKS